MVGGAVDSVFVWLWERILDGKLAGRGVITDYPNFRCMQYII